MKSKWTIVITVWLALGLSIYFSKRHEWLDYAWLLMFALFVVATVVNFGIAIYRKKKPPGKRSDLHTRLPTLVHALRFGRT
ncbi:MAG TPA: hypothetical protein VMH20_11975 [Verrucomicrobiae bacterium]|nr:hypothetical protein [Verrucomicrobiae bacterium]